MTISASLIAITWNPFYWDSISILLLIAGVVVCRFALPANGSRGVQFARELMLVIPAALTYFMVRGLVDARGSDAEAHAQRLIEIERKIGLHREAALQDLILGSPLLVDIVNWIYIWAHWPLITGIVIWMVLKYREDFPLYRNAFLISGAMGMIVFALYPVAPPRLMGDLTIVDTVTQQSQSYRVLQPPALTNPYAALPSLHFGWNLLMGIAVVRHAQWLGLKVFGFIMPLAMFASIVLTGNHYILDGVLGGLFVIVALVVASWIQRNSGRVTPMLQRRPAPSAETQ